jgi:histidinol-phosphate aminotransferase
MTRFLDSKLKKLVAYTPGEQPKNMSELIKLNTNESPFPPAPGVIDMIKSEEVEKLRLYSDPDCKQLVSTIAEYHHISEHQVFPGNGSDEVLAFIFHGLCPNGAAFADITYGFYPVFAEMFDAIQQIVPLRDDFSIKVEDYAGISGTVFIANPNAPTGLCLPLSDIETLVSQNRDRLVVVDEAYIDYGGESAQSLLDVYDNLLIVRTLSKSRSLAGGRVGYALGSEELVKDLNTMKFSFNPYNVNRLSIIAGAEAMKDTSYFNECCAKIIENREYTTVELRKLGFDVLPSKANFIFAGANQKISGIDYFSKLRDNGILVRHFNSPRICDYVRITIGTTEQMQRLVQVTKEVF